MFGNAEILNRAAPMGINVISSLSPFTASSSGNTPHSPVSSIFHSGTGRPIAFTSKGTPNSMKQTHDMTSLSALVWMIRRLRLRRSAGSIWASPFAMTLKRDHHRESCRFPEGDMPCSGIRGAILPYTRCTGAFMRNGFRKVNTIPKAHSALRCI